MVQISVAQHASRERQRRLARVFIQSQQTDHYQSILVINYNQAPSQGPSLDRASNSDETAPADVHRLGHESGTAQRFIPPPPQRPKRAQQSTPALCSGNQYGFDRAAAPFLPARAGPGAPSSCSPSSSNASSPTLTSSSSPSTKSSSISSKPANAHRPRREESDPLPTRPRANHPCANCKARSRATAGHRAVVIEQG